MDDIRVVANYCERVLSLKEAKLSDSYFYKSLTLCIIDSVFSIRARYETTMRTVGSYCKKFNLRKIRTSKESLPAIAEQQSVTDLLQEMQSRGAEYFAESVFQNRQRTCARNGILKSEAVLRFALVLATFEVNYLQDMHKILANDQFEYAIRKIPGQRSGISLKYFFMLAGSDDLIKPDMHIMNFLKDAFLEKGIVRSISLDDAQVLLSGASDILKLEYRDLTPRLLDNTIWSYQRKQKKPPQQKEGWAQRNQNLNPIRGLPKKGDIFKARYRISARMTLRAGGEETSCSSNTL